MDRQISTSHAERKSMTAFVVIIPACNEEQVIGTLITALRQSHATFLVIVSVNGCIDNTAQAARVAVHGDHRFLVIESPIGGKCAAINRGEAQIPQEWRDLPRFFVDADVVIHGQDFLRLAQRLSGAEPSLVSPKIDLKLDGCTPLSRLAALGWQERPYFQNGAHQFVLGVNAAGRNLWGHFPEIIADDAFILSHFTPEQRSVALDTSVCVQFPRTALAFFGMQRRWIAGDRQLRQIRAHVRSQRPRVESATFASVASEATKPSKRTQNPKLLATAVYLTLRGTAMLLDRLGIRQRTWYRDSSTRTSM
jgi:hypothetical protein